MPDGPESIGEVARLLKAMQASNKERFDSLEHRLDRLVSNEVHSRDVANLDRRMGDLTKALSNEREQRVAAIKDEAEARKDGIKSIGTISRWAIATSLMALAVFVTILFRSGGGVT